MTAQISDRIIFQDREYMVTAASVPIDVHPKKFGITPGIMGTACYRGYHCKYRIINNMLYLDGFTL